MAQRSAKILRILFLAIAAAALMEAYLTRGVIGGGDATWYSLAVGDFLTQVRHGVFPVWVGQSRYLFYGGIFPLRVAPYLEHFAALVDLATGRQLAVFRVMNLTLVVSMVAGVLSCYLCLSRVLAGRPWLAAALALLYGSCPGVVGMAYSQDLYMSFMTLPFLPVVFLGIVRSFDKDDLLSRLLMAGGLAGAWLAHPPIALACGMAAFATQPVRLARNGVTRRSIILDLAAVGSFAALAFYPIVSVLSIPRDPGVAAVGDFLAQVRQAFPDNWRPLPRSVPLNNLQVGYGLVLLFCLAAWRVAMKPEAAAISLLACAAVFATAIFPVPGLTYLLWHAAPQAVLNIINVWPMQRLIVSLSLSTLFALALTSRPGRSGSWTIWLFVVPALIWSGYQASLLVENADQTSPSPSEFAVSQQPENTPVTNMFIAISMKSRAPRYASGGVMDPEMENRLLDPASMELVGGNVDSVAPGFGPGPRRIPEAVLPGEFTGKLDANPGILDLSPKLTLEPKRRYLLLLGFFDRSYAGTLLLSGEGFRRQYHLPLSGEPRAFGSGPESSRAIPLWTSGDAPIEVQVRFVPDPGQSPMAFTPFARFELRGYDPDQLPIRLESLLPYTARVRTTAAAVLETPRLAVPTYVATVDGSQVATTTSADGYVCVPLGAGSHEVKVEYRAPVVVQLAYWGCGAAWVVFAALLIHQIGLSGRRREQLI